MKEKQKLLNGEKDNPLKIAPALFQIILVIILISLSNYAFAQTPDSLLTSVKLKRLSLEELMNLEVTSVSKRPEKLSEVASAIQVITHDDIRNSGAKTLAEALRLAVNLQVAQANASEWAISARGFNNTLSNKLLVLIDGRTVYTPLYAGVFWDMQNVLLEDVDRIEVISGPGGTLWGANAVNGVINIITKNSRDTRGLFFEGATGSALPALGSLRYGGKLASDLSYRVYATGFKMGHAVDTNGTNAKDEWTLGQGGVRLDWNATQKDNLTLQSNISYGKPNPAGADTTIVAEGDNTIVQWNHKISQKSDFELQAYYDHISRDFGQGLTEDLKTYDIYWQNRYQFGQRNVVTYGLDFRLMNDHVTNIALLTFLPAHKILYLYSAFVQDDIKLIENRLRLTVGSKIEHNSYTGFEFQPNGRLTWTPTNKQTIWAAISRAVRTPSRIDRDFYLYGAPGIPTLSGNSSFISENLLAYELGWRLQPQNDLSVSLATFYNVYDNIRSIEPGPSPSYIPFTLGNGVKGNTYGIELSANYQLTNWWSFRGGYTFLKKNLSLKPASKDMNEGSAESNDPEHQFLVQSAMNISNKIELGAIIRYVDKLPKPYVSGYTELDARMAWKLNEGVELSIVGQNLLNSRHLEFASSSSAREIERSIYLKITCQF